MSESLYGRLVVWVNTIDTRIIVHGHKKVLNWYIDPNDIKRNESSKICI